MRRRTKKATEPDWAPWPLQLHLTVILTNSRGRRMAKNPGSLSAGGILAFVRGRLFHSKNMIHIIFPGIGNVVDIYRVFFDTVNAHILLHE